MILQSIVMPVHNGSRWLDNCLASILSQAGFTGSLELSIYNDASTVGSYSVFKMHYLIYSLPHYQPFNDAQYLRNPARSQGGWGAI